MKLCVAFKCKFLNEDNPKRAKRFSRVFLNEFKTFILWIKKISIVHYLNGNC